MDIQFWQVDAFSDKPFKGNPAAVIFTDTPLKDSLMQEIASEMNVSDTAFVELQKDNDRLIRWFSPESEIDLCGHATLAAAHIYFSYFSPKDKTITFQTKKYGPIKVTQNSSRLTLALPLLPYKEIHPTEIPDKTINALCHQKPISALVSNRLVLIYEDQETIKTMKPNFDALKEYDKTIVVTAASRPEYDFVSRHFTTIHGVNEDPVTGSSHSILTPYWSEKLGKKKMKAFQASKRGGEIFVELLDTQVLVSGSAITTLSGSIMNIMKVV